MNDDAASFIRRLVGRSMWGSGRAVEMEMFMIGRRVEVIRRGRTHVVGEYALHVQSAWRIRSGDGVLVGSRDLQLPPEGEPEDGFDYDGRRSRREDHLDRFWAHGEAAHLIDAARVTSAGDLAIDFADGCCLEALVDMGLDARAGDDAWECWRLLEPDVAAPQLVVGPGGVIGD